MASEAAEIREAIEQTRAELGDTVQALARKADVKARAREKVEDTKRKGVESAHHAAHKVVEVSRPAVEAPAKVVSNRRVALPLAAGLAGAGGVFMALRLKNRQEK